MTRLIEGVHAVTGRQLMDVRRRMQCNALNATQCPSSLLSALAFLGVGISLGAQEFITMVLFDAAYLTG